VTHAVLLQTGFRRVAQGLQGLQWELGCTGRLICADPPSVQCCGLQIPRLCSVLYEERCYRLVEQTLHPNGTYTPHINGFALLRMRLPTEAWQDATTW
jgi:hypothetical protein